MYVAVAAAGAVAVAVVAAFVAGLLVVMPAPAIRGPARGADAARRGAMMALAARSVSSWIPRLLVGVVATSIPKTGKMTRLLADPARTELPATLPERCTPMYKLVS